MPDGDGSTTRPAETALVRNRLVSSVVANIVRQPLVRALTLVGSVVAARTLGPESLAVVAAVNATATSILAFCDFGITPSTSRIMPDVAVRYGRAEGIKVRQQLLRLKLCLMLAGFVGLVILKLLGVWHQSVGSSAWFLPLVGASILLNAVADVRREEWIAALRMSNLATIQIAIALITPLVVIAASLLTRDPYVVAAAQMVPVMIELGFLLLRSYDLDTHVEAPAESKVKLSGLFSTYWRYSGVTYLIFLFNRFVFGLPLTLFLLAWLGIGAGALGNVAVSVAIVAFGLDMASAPLASLRVPILARLHAENNAARFMRSQRLMSAIIVLTSSLLALIMLTIMPAALTLIYGTKYQAAVVWGIPAAVLALAFSFFSLGNATVRQVDRYGPVLIGLGAALALVVTSNMIGVRLLPQSLWPPLVVTTYVASRGIFWLITDLGADALIFHWQGTEIKLRGLLALGLALGTAYWINHTLALSTLAASLLAFCVSASIFLLVFRLLGGVGADVRLSVAGVVGGRVPWAVRML